MHQRIDHATVVTCRDGQAVVLYDTSITWRDGVITAVVPAADATAARSGQVPPRLLRELRGRPLGAILIQIGRLTRPTLLEVLERQKTQRLAIGQMLVDLGKITEADVEWALAAQAGRDPGPLPGRPGEGEPERIDGRDKLVIPGLVNTHHHLFQSLTRCLRAVQNAPLFDWLVGLYPKWRELSYDALRQAAGVSIAELLLTGCTTTSDHMYLFPPDRDVRIEAVLEAADALGIRIHACRGSMSMGASAGGLPPDTCVQPEDEILRDCRRAIERFHDAEPFAMRRIDLAPCAPFSITTELFEQTRDLAAEHGVLLHTHAAETLDEERFCVERYGIRPIAYLHRHGWLGPNVYLAHCVCLNDEEIALLAETRTGVTHCPSSNMRLGSGIAPVRKMLDAGVKVGLAVDGSSSNDGGNVLAEARQALLLQRVLGGAGAMTPEDAFRMATLGGAEVLQRPELGRIEPGRAADLAIYDVNDVAWAGGFAQDPLGALMLCTPPRPEQVIVAGRTVVDAGTITGLDTVQLTADFNQLVRDRFR